MFSLKSLVILVCGLCMVLAQNNGNSDSEITRVRSLSDEERNEPPPNEKTKSIYLVNILPVPKNRRTGDEGSEISQGNNDLNINPRPIDPRGRVPALFFLQKVNDNGRLPDGIYYRPADEAQTPPPIIQKDITNLQAFALARGVPIRNSNVNGEEYKQQ